MPLDASVDKIRVRGRSQTSTSGAADAPPTFFATVPQLLNKASHSRIKPDRVNPATNTTSGATQPYFWDASTGSWWADLIAVDDTDVLASGQTVGPVGRRRLLHRPALLHRAQARRHRPIGHRQGVLRRPVTGAALAQGSGGIRTVWLDDLAALYAPSSVPGLGIPTVEDIQDAVAPLFTGGGHTGIGFTYDDAGNRILAVVTVTGDLPESTAGARTTAAATPTDLLGLINEYTGTVAQPMPAATPGRVLAFRQRTTGLTLQRAGSDVFVLGDGSTATSLAPSLAGELVQLHCTTTGQWRAVSDFKPTSALATAFGAILNTHLLAWFYADAFRLVSATRDSNGAVTTGSVVWPDGSTGTYTQDTASTLAPGKNDAWHITYVPTSGATKTITQSAVTRDANGAVTAQPAPVVS